jgi:hypothetical protein
VKYCAWCGHEKDAHILSGRFQGCFKVLDPKTAELLDGTCFDDNRCICTGFMKQEEIK